MMNYENVVKKIAEDEAKDAHRRLCRSMTQGVWMDIQRRFRLALDDDGPELLTNPDAPDVIGWILLLGEVERIHAAKGDDEDALIQLAADAVGLVIRRRLQKQQANAERSGAS